jgi:hypothetical protein
LLVPRQNWQPRNHRKARERTVKQIAKIDHRRDPRSSGQRSLGAAEGVLVVLRHCSLDEAFIEIVETAKQQAVAPLELAGALVAIAENDATRDVDGAAVAAVDRAWGILLRSGPSYDDDRGQAQQPAMTVCPSAEAPKSIRSEP